MQEAFIFINFYLFSLVSDKYSDKYDDNFEDRFPETTL